MKKFTRFVQAAAPVAASAADVFAFLDGQTHVASHISGWSWKVLGTNLKPYMDNGRTRAVGSTFGVAGHILGIPLSVDEVVTSRNPGVRKTWRTRGIPRLAVIGPYTMGFELTPRPGGTVVRVFMEYCPVAGGLPWPIRLALADAYARWCTRRMIKDVRAHINTQFDDRLPGSQQDKDIGRQRR